MQQLTTEPDRPCVIHLKVTGLSPATRHRRVFR
jgi:hypothetical protein